MSHTGNGEEDFEDLESRKLDDDEKEAIKQVRIEARRIIDRLEPRHINSWPDLIVILDDCLETAKRNEHIFRRK